MEMKPDIDQVLKRYEAWWDCEIADRPLTSIIYGKPQNERIPVPEKSHGSVAERWLDTDFLVESSVARLSNTVHAGDSLPIAYPNLGPEVYSAFYGCPLVFSEDSSWTEPILGSLDPAAYAELQVDLSNQYFQKLIEMTDALTEAGSGRFIVGYTDIHPGGDAVAAFREPQDLCIDVLERPDAIAQLCEQVTDDFFEVYDFFHDKLQAAGMTSTTWMPCTSQGKFHVPSNDFSCMISARHFQEIFYPALVRECQHMDRNIYHLDGPDALRHLDLLLSTPEIHAIQWVAGAGNEGWQKWIDVYRRIQSAGKALWLPVPLGDLDLLMETLDPAGVWTTVYGVGDGETAGEVLKRMARWGGRN